MRGAGAVYVVVAILIADSGAHARPGGPLCSCARIDFVDLVAVERVAEFFETVG